MPSGRSAGEGQSSGPAPEMASLFVTLPNVIVQLILRAVKGRRRGGGGIQVSSAKVQVQPLVDCPLVDTATDQELRGRGGQGIVCKGGGGGIPSLPTLGP